MSFLESLGGITLAGLFLFFILRHLEKQNSTAEENRKLIVESDDLDEFEKFWGSHPELSYERALRKYYEDENKKKEAIKKAKKRVQAEKEYEERRKCENITRRVYAYKYEKFILSLFSPLAKRDSITSKWECHDSLPLKYILRKIEEEYHITEVEAKSLFEQLLDNDLLYQYYKSKGSIELGNIFNVYYNVVSENDLNLDKYIKQFGQRCSLDELKKELKRMGVLSDDIAGRYNLIDDEDEDDDDILPF